MSNIDKAAEHLGANALKMIKLILLKHDAAIIEASQEAIEAAVLEEREACAMVSRRHSHRDDDMGAIIERAIRARGQA
jgi:hypothetical protein